MATTAPPTGTLPAEPLAVSVDLPRARVELAGELDRESAHHLLDAVEVLTAGSNRRWQLDAGAVTFCDLTGVRALSSAHSLAREHGRDLDLVASSRPVDRMVQLVGSDRVFPPALSGRRRRAAARRRWCGTTDRA